MCYIYLSPHGKLVVLDVFIYFYMQKLLYFYAHGHGMDEGTVKLSRFIWTTFEIANDL